MIKIIQLALLLAVIFGMNSQARADLLIEPVVGYSGGVKGEVENGESFSGGSGASFGGRLGYQKLGFQLGLDYLKSSYNMKDDEFKSNFNTSEFAGFVGFEFPVLLRAYAGYIFSATGEAKKYDSGSSIDKMDLSGGTGAKFGLGFTVLPFLDINLEYRNVTFTDNKFGTQTMDDDVSASVYMIGVSLPFTI